MFLSAQQDDLDLAYNEPLALKRDSRALLLRGVLDQVQHGSQWVNSRTRRSLECVIAAATLLMLSPVMLLCALLVRVSSRGPILFRQRRMGRNGEEFVFYKFRSMVEVESECASPEHTAAGDRRITTAGAFLRRYKLDELPQFWNVLKGDMSLVGPRPKLACHEGLRMSFRPGITGEATLAFRSEEQLLTRIPAHEIDDFYDRSIKPMKAYLDSLYMEHATFLSDLHLICRTAISCFSVPEEPAPPAKEFPSHSKSATAVVT